MAPMIARASMAPGAPPPQASRARLEVQSARSMPVTLPDMDGDITMIKSAPMADSGPLSAPRAAPRAAVAPAKKSGPGILNRMLSSFGLGGKAAEVEQEESAKEAAFTPPPPPSAPAGVPSTGAAPLPESALAAAQSADGSYGGDLRRSGAALLLLLWWGHTRRKGLRSRTVGKLATWLGTRSEPLAAELLGLLEAAERGESPTPTATWESLFDAGPEGAALKQALGR